MNIVLKIITAIIIVISLNCNISAQTSSDPGDINFNYDYNIFYFSAFGFSLMYNFEDFDEPLNDYEFGWHAFEMEYGWRFLLIGTTVFKDFGAKSTFLPLTMKIPVLIFPSETFVYSSATEITPAGLYLEINTAWLNTEEYEYFVDLKVKYENGALFSIWASALLEDPLGSMQKSYYFGVSLYLGKYWVISGY